MLYAYAVSNMAEIARGKLATPYRCDGLAYEIWEERKAAAW